MRLPRFLASTAWVAAFAAFSLAAPAAHADPASCATVHMSTPGWSDIASTNSVAGLLLQGLGYKQDIKTLSVPITFQALSNKQIDLFLGNWMPAQGHFTKPLIAAGKIVVLHQNLAGAKYTLAVPSYVAAAGVTSFADLAAHAEQFGRKIYGIDAGSPGNANIQKAIDNPALKLSGWTVVPSSEQGMLAEVKRDVAQKRWIVFLGWEPHPMNTEFHLTYLSGGDAYFGPNFGGATVNTVTRAGFPQQCPNLARLFSQLTYTVDGENSMMTAIDVDHKSGPQAAEAYIKAHPDLLTGWLQGVTTLDGKPGLPAVKSSLGITQ